LSLSISAFLSVTNQCFQIGRAQGLGFITVNTLDSSGSSFTPSLLILYDSSYTEKARGVPLLGNSYTFSFLAAGTYTVEAYVDDMFVGSVGSITLGSAQSVTKTLQTQWSKKTLTVTVYYKDGTTPMPNAFVTVNSWNGQTQQYSIRGLGTTNSAGQISFLLWPTSLSTEKYKVSVNYYLESIGEQSDVKVDRYLGGSIGIVSTKEGNVVPPSVGIPAGLSNKIKLVFDGGENLFPVHGLFFDGDFNIANNFQSYRLNSANSYVKDYTGDSKPDSPAYTYAVKSGDVVVVEYWIYYAGDVKESMEPSHEHDFESVFVWFNTVSDSVEKISINQHMWTNNYVFSSDPGVLYLAVEKGGHGMILLQGDRNGDGAPDDIDRNGFLDVQKPDNCKVLSPELATSCRIAADNYIVSSLISWKNYDGVNPTEGFGDNSLLRTGLSYDIMDPLAFVGLKGIEFYEDTLDIAMAKPILLDSLQPFTISVGQSSVNFYLTAPWQRVNFGAPEKQWQKVSFELLTSKLGTKAVTWFMSLKLLNLVGRTLVNSVVSRALVAYFDPVNATIIDSSGHALGYANGELVNQLPGGLILWKSDAVDVFMVINPENDLIYEVASLGKGNYNLTIAMINSDNETTKFEANSVPVDDKSLHTYSINWTALKSQELGVNMTIDQNGDGKNDKSIIVGSEVSAPAIESAQQFDFVPIVIGVVLAVVTIVGVAFMYYRGKNNQDWKSRFVERSY
jgi:hypothetical protein